MKIKRCSSILIITICLFLFPNLMSANTENPTIQINSESAILIDANTGQVLYEKRSQEKRAPASITKIATAIYAIEKGNLDDIVTVSEKARNVEGTRVYLEVGEQVPLKKLVQGLLINSGNDAGVAIAEHLGGSVDGFVQDFNKFLQEEIGVEHTRFTNPHGLYNPDHVTTAEDMAIITQYAMNNEEFSDIFKMKELEWNGESWDTTLINHHEMVRDDSYNGITGGKNGFVTESGFTLVTTVDQGDLSLIAITLQAMTDEQAYEDTTTLLDYGFQSFETSITADNQQFQDSHEHKYLLEQNISYTKKIGEVVEEEVLPTGELLIKGEDGRTIHQQMLRKIENNDRDTKVKNEVVASPIAQGETKAEIHLSIIIPLSLMLTFLLSGIFYFQVRRL